MKAAGTRARLKEEVRLFLGLQALLACLVGLIVMFTYRIEESKQLHALRTNEARLLEHQGELMRSKFNAIVSDLMYLKENHELHAYLEGGEPEHKVRLALDWLSLSQRKGIYDQIRFIHIDGREVVRINYNDGAPSIVPDGQLQDKGKRYYFTDSIILRQGEVVISPLDLNIENGDLESPGKPMIRFATPLMDYEGYRHGIVVLNYLGKDLLDGLRKRFTDSQGQPMLLNQEGYWLLGPEPDREWGFMYGIEDTFGRDFPGVWELISGEESGQSHNASGLFTFITIYPAQEGWISSIGSPEPFMPSGKRLAAGEFFWKAVSFVPRASLKAVTGPLLKRMAAMYTTFFLMLAAISWYLSSLIVRRRLVRQLIEEHDRHLQSIIDGVGESLMVIGPDYSIRLMNRAARESSEPVDDLSGQILCHKLSHQSDTPCAGGSSCPRMRSESWRG